MKENDKLRVLIPHWIKHNAEHAAEFRRWAAQAGEAAADLRAAAAALAGVSDALGQALEKLGGTLPDHQNKHS